MQKNDICRKSFEDYFAGEDLFRETLGNELAPFYYKTHVQEQWEAWQEAFTIHISEMNKLKELLNEARAALVPFAEDPKNTSSDNAPCHNGITTKFKCGRCSRGFFAHEIVEKIEQALD